MQRTKWMWLVLMVAVAMLPTFSVAAQDAAKPDLGGRTVTVAVENAYPPFNSLDEGGEAVGWDYDTINEICARINCVPEFIETSWEGMIIAVSNGEFDIAGDGITITAERKELVDFSIGYADIIQRLMVRLDEDRYATNAEFIGGDFTVGVQLGTTNFITAQSLVEEARIVGFSDFGSAVQALVAGDVDAVIIDDVAGQGYVGENDDKIRLLDDVISANEQLGYIFPKGSELKDAFNWGLMSLVTDGTLDTINAKWGLGPLFALESNPPDLGGATVTIAIENAYPPFNYLDESGTAVGWDYDAVNAICERLNCVPEFVETSWEGMIVAVSNGEFDLAADGITITTERKELVDFSIGYADIVQRLMVRLDEDRFASNADFVGGDFMVGVQLGTTNFITAQKFVGDERIVGFSDFGSAVQALIAGDVDAVIIDDVAGQGYVGENDDKIRLLEDEIATNEQLGFIFPKGSALVPAFNWAIMSLIADGTLNPINEKWGFSPYLTFGASE